MGRSIVLGLALVFATETANARADMLSYNMTGTINSTHQGSVVLGNAGENYQVGDKVSWTLQYNSSTPMVSTNGQYSSYLLSGPVVTNIVDQTTGIHFFVPSTVPSQILLSSQASANSIAQFIVWDTSKSTDPSSYQAGLHLSTALNSHSRTIPTLANLRLGSMPYLLGSSSPSSLQWNSWSDGNNAGSSMSFTASVNTITAAPEPASLTLCLFGVVYLFTCHFVPPFFCVNNRRNSSVFLVEGKASRIIEMEYQRVASQMGNRASYLKQLLIRRPLNKLQTTETTLFLSSLPS